MSLLIGFGSKARHGKDSAVNAIIDYVNGTQHKLAQYYGPGVRVEAKQFRFAEALYEEARTLHGMTDKDAPLLQRIGAARRAENVNYWVDKVFSQMDSFYKQVPNGIALISDVRYKNEAEAIKARSGFLIRMNRLNEDGTPFVDASRPADHPSEIDLDNFNWDYFITAKSGNQALVAELAITHYEYFRALKGV